MTDEERGPEAPVEPAAARPPLRQRLGRIVGIGAGVLFALFAVVNAQYVDFSWLLGSTEVVTSSGERQSGGVPLILLLVGAFVLGVVVGATSSWMRGRRRRRG